MRLVLDAADLRLAGLVHHLTGDVLLDDDLVRCRGLEVVWRFGVDVLLLGGLVEGFIHDVLVGGGGSTVVVDVRVGQLHRSLGRLEVAGEIQTGRRGVAVLVVLLLLDLLLVLLGEILEEILL